MNSASENFTKVIYPGTIPQYWRGQNNYPAPVHCKIKYTAGKLSISGVIGALKNGNAIGSCGQIDICFQHRDSAENDSRYSHLIAPTDFAFADGWNSDLWLDFLHIWKRWHLNDMQAACEHQRALPEFQFRNIEITRAALKWKDYDRLTRQAQADIAAQYGEGVAFYHDKRVGIPYFEESKHAPHRPSGVSLKDGYKFSPAMAILRVLYDNGISKSFTKVAIDPKKLRRSASRIKKYMPPDFDIFSVLDVSTATKGNGWVYPTEHKDGILTKECPVCEYKYGTKWLHEDVPADVLDFLRDLPVASRLPAWV